MNSNEVQNPRRKLSYSLCRVCLFLINNSSSDSKALLRFVAFSVHHAFLFFDAKPWPQSQSDLFTCTTALHCGHTFLRRIDLLHSIACMLLHCGYTFLNLSLKTVTNVQVRQKTKAKSRDHTLLLHTCYSLVTSRKNL